LFAFFLYFFLSPLKNSLCFVLFYIFFTKRAQDGDFLGIVFPIQNAAAITYDEGTAGVCPVAMAAIIDPVDGNSARLDGISTSRRYSVCAHIDYSEDDGTSHLGSDNYFAGRHHADAPVISGAGLRAAVTAASPRAEVLKDLFSQMPPRPELLSVYSCGDSLGLVTKKHVWAFVKTSPTFFSLSGFQTVPSAQATASFEDPAAGHTRSSSSHFDPSSARSFRSAVPGTAAGPATTYDPKNNLLWVTEQDATFLRHSGRCLARRLLLGCPRARKRGATS
jgi:hypothetical protein